MSMLNWVQWECAQLSLLKKNLIMLTDIFYLLRIITIKSLRSFFLLECYYFTCELKKPYRKITAFTEIRTLDRWVAEVTNTVTSAPLKHFTLCKFSGKNYI